VNDANTRTYDLYIIESDAYTSAYDAYIINYIIAFDANTKAYDVYTIAHDAGFREFSGHGANGVLPTTTCRKIRNTLVGEKRMWASTIWNWSLSAML
jgi:hypothetical protein